MSGIRYSPAQAAILDALGPFDREEKGEIDVRDLGLITKELGKTYTEAEVFDLAALADPDETGFISFENFLEILGPEMECPDITLELPAAFRLIDREGLGFISEDDLQTISAILGDFLTEDEISEIMKESDKNHDDKMDWVEFEGMMTREF